MNAEKLSHRHSILKYLSSLLKFSIGLAMWLWRSYKNMIQLMMWNFIQLLFYMRWMSCAVSDIATYNVSAIAFFRIGKFSVDLIEEKMNYFLSIELIVLMQFI